MAGSYERPFEPVDFGERSAALFALGDMIAQLRREEAHQSGHRSALTLLHEPDLTLVLTAVCAGAECQEHAAAESTVLLGLEGTIAIKGARGGGVLQIGPGVAAALAPELVHTIEAVTDAAYLTIIGSDQAGQAR